MVSRIVEAITQFLAWLHRGQKILPPSGIVRVNLGSGLRVAPGWINIDGSLSALAARWPTPLLRLVYRLTSVKKWHPQAEYIQILKKNRFIFHNFQFGIPLPDNSVDYVFSAHMLEHMPREDAQALVLEIFRVLKKGGRARIDVPDLELAFSLYQRGEKETALGFFFLPACSGSLGRHEYLYDFEMLASLLRQTGFLQVERCSHQHGAVPDLELLDHSPEQTLYVEAVKA